MKTHRDLVLDINDWLDNFAADFKEQISADAYELLECMAQSIGHDLEEVDKEVAKTDAWANEIRV